MKRFGYGSAFLICTALLLFSSYLQMSKGIEPCALCVLQRGMLIFLWIIFFIGFFLKNKIGRRCTAFSAIIIASLGALFAGRQVWLQHLPVISHENCAADLRYMLKVLPFNKIVQTVFKGTPECGQMSWQFLSFSLAEWSLFFFLFFIAFSLWQLIGSFKRSSRR